MTEVQPQTKQPNPQEVDLQRLREAVNVLTENDPAAWEKLKKAFPELKSPYDNVKPLLEPIQQQISSIAESIKKDQEERAKQEEERKKNETALDLEKALSGARSRYNLTEDGFNKMVERMKATQNYTDADAAAAWVVSENPPSDPGKPSWVPQNMNLFASKDKDDAYALLHKDPNAFLDNELAKWAKNPEAYNKGEI